MLCHAVRSEYVAEGLQNAGVKSGAPASLEGAKGDVHTGFGARQGIMMVITFDVQPSVDVCKCVVGLPPKLTAGSDGAEDWKFGRKQARGLAVGLQNGVVEGCITRNPKSVEVDPVGQMAVPGPQAQRRNLAVLLQADRTAPGACRFGRERRALRRRICGVCILPDVDRHRQNAGGANAGTAAAGD